MAPVTVRYLGERMRQHYWQVGSLTALWLGEGTGLKIAIDAPGSSWSTLDAAESDGPFNTRAEAEAALRRIYQSPADQEAA